MNGAQVQPGDGLAHEVHRVVRGDEVRQPWGQEKGLVGRVSMVWSHAQMITGLRPALNGQMG